MADGPLRIGLLIRALTVGGAERQLVNLAVGLRHSGHEVYVFVFYLAATSLEAELVDAGVPLVDLRKRGRWDLAGFMRRLRAAVRSRSVDVIYSFLPTANVVAATVWVGAGCPPVVWGIRGSHNWSKSDDWLGRFLVYVQRLLAPRVAAIICNSQSAVAVAVAEGWPSGRLHLVHNGLDSRLFRFSLASRDRWRKELRAAGPDLLVGVAGRLDPIKGIEVLLMAFRNVVRDWPALKLVFAGDGVPDYMAALQHRARSLGIEDRLVWLGRVQDMAGFYSAVDLVCLPSLSEGCSNVIAEALACGTPVVATRVGDNPLLVPDPGRLVEPGNSHDLEQALRQAVASHGQSCQEELRRVILEKLGLSTMVEKTAGILRAVSSREY